MRIAIIVSCLVFSVSGFASSRIEFIEENQIARLSSEFESAKSVQSLDSLNNSNWSCELFGAKSRMQRASKIKLYKFKAVESGIANTGAQIVKAYRLKNGELTGSSENGAVIDQIRLANQSLLISKMHLKNQPDSVVAFATCSTQ